MKLQDLLEGPPPVFNPKEMPSAQIFGTGKFYSEKTIKQKFDIIGQFEKDDKKYFVILDKNLEFGCVIYAGLREADQERGGFIVASIDFKNPINITYDRDVTYDRSKVIQVDGVEIYKSEDKRLGLGFYLYLSLIKAGYVVISDNYQYIGGKELWKKIIKMANLNFNYSVYVLDNGHPRLDSEGNPIKIKSSDIENEEEFWSTEPEKEKYHTLFLAKKD